MDLSPREVIPTAARGKKKPWFAYAVLAIVLLAGGLFVAKFLTSAIDYYCNVDEIGVKDGCDVGRTIRIQGVVEKGTLEITEGGTMGDTAQTTATHFTITFNGSSMSVVVGSKPTGMFKECQPVVVTGKVIESDDGSQLFEGDEVLVKHSEEYDAENKGRVAKSQAEETSCSQKA